MTVIKPSLKIAIICLSILVFSRCSVSPVQQIESAHKKSDFLSKKAVQFDIQIFFGGKESFNAKMTLSTNSSKALIELYNGEKMYVVGDKVFTPSTINKSKEAIRFDVYTWSYFFLSPYKLSDHGTVWSEFGQTPLNSKTYNTQRLSFEAGTGDAPDDWYFIYTDQDTNLIKTSAYIITAHSSKNEAEKDPHAIQYLNYKEIDGIPMATEWKFWEWRAGKDMNKQLGSATLSEIKFIEDTAHLFTPPAGFLAK